MIMIDTNDARKQEKTKSCTSSESESCFFFGLDFLPPAAAAGGPVGGMRPGGGPENTIKK